MRTRILKNTVWIAFGIFTFNFILKFLYIDTPAIGGDEPFSIFYSQADFTTILELSQHENNPPFFTMLLKLWTGYFGLSPISVRFLPLIFSSLTAAFIYIYVNEIANKNFGFIASGLFTFSNYHIYFSHEARPYALFGLLTILALHFAFRLLKHGRKSAFIILTIINVLLIYNHFFGFFVLMIELLMLIIQPFERKEWKKLIWSWGITAILYLPYIPIILHRFSVSSTGGTWLSIPDPTELYNIFVKFSNVPLVAAFGLLFLLGGIMLNMLVWKDRTFTFLFISLFLPLLFIFLISQMVPMFLDRYFVYLGVIYIVTLSYFFYKLQTPVSQAILVGLTSLGFILTVNLKAGNQEPDGLLVETMINNRSDNQQTFISPPYYQYNFAYHFQSDWFEDPTRTWAKMNEENIFPIYNDVQLSEYQLRDTCFVIAKGYESDLETNSIVQKLKASYQKDSILFIDNKNVLIRYTGINPH